VGHPDTSDPEITGPETAGPEITGQVHEFAWVSGAPEDGLQIQPPFEAFEE
jgi:hypothetical protein